MVSICLKRNMVTIKAMDDMESMDDMGLENMGNMVPTEIMEVLVTTITVNMEIKTIIL